MLVIEYTLIQPYLSTVDGFVLSLSLTASLKSFAYSEVFYTKYRLIMKSTLISWFSFHPVFRWHI